MKRTQVLVIGAGPVGCVAAFYLAKQGIDVITCEKGPDCAQDLRASTFHPPTLEMLDTLGITKELIARGLKAPIYQWRERATHDYYEFDLSEIADATPFPYRVQCEQYHLAGLLAEKLAAEDNAEVFFNHRMLGYEETPDGIVASLETPHDIRKIKCDYLIGADGSNSVVRKLMGVEFDGFTYPEKFLCLTTNEPLENYLPDLSLVNYVSDPKEWLVLLRVPSLWRVLVPAGSDDEDSFLTSDEKRDQVFEGLIGKKGVETAHRTIYKMHQRVAQKFRGGNIAIIGDAAHLNNPLGGFGMNSGIHDAFNLCEKLVRIIKDGEKSDPLLDQFERERRQQTTEFVQEQTKQNMAYMQQGTQEQHRLRRDNMERLTKDPEARRDYLLRQSMIQSVRASQRKQVA
ncbi:FAD-dependent oxidoreductase [Eilatimonas milleporae]|uniref:3-(3-hydroxy-phenyl)propionate hydroxylase n=1 Tax=Eilatimonas milleporae TaxID=911205 RepID=A0A3M0BWY6_9PROT|nr:FAD-dependent oxidoreductase [Eilatimonas milleporae]RMB01938.1 3-(3-hydroxy-phenyl)propionate hydroxylase [Eilatimonas milleporae]